VNQIGNSKLRLRRNAAVILAFWALSPRQNVTQWSLPPCCCRFVRSWLVAGAARINSAKVVFRSRATAEGEVETAAGLDYANKPMLKTRTKTMTRTPQYARRVVVVIKQTASSNRPSIA
jgi:hypothetical protein